MKETKKVVQIKSNGMTSPDVKEITLRKSVMQG